MKPSEFWNCTYREANLYVQSFFIEKKESYKLAVGLLDILGEKLLLGDVTRGFFSQQPKHISLIQELFPEEVEQRQDPRDMARRLRSWNDNVVKKGDDNGGQTNN